ncbi:uncharacterized protein MEPE_06731 [Melanopsichium pennsylvanicum]|uniref:Pentatricopeptide repeat protein n=2 Tax=Melanopsichium pennsylvanicum TaxID=63383 RepID=A0AAJ5C8H7_9BASI|nr:pentatricopeptide repeat protein [Melanopsichium pennsylvanicum 4]SNX88020.1 uncharacterized protein MEPE_06731 [Melanopsichium pennsylvanicum]
MPVTSAAKLASHLWRGAAQSAANAAHNSANTFRGAFQGASSGTTSSTGSSTSGWASGLSSGGSSAGAGAGGAKFHAGRGAHFSYQHTGRALSQASATTNTDAKDKSNDDDDEIRRQKAYKLRLDGQQYEKNMLAASAHLTTSHMQVRFRSAFAAKQAAPLLVTDAEHASTASTEHVSVHSANASTSAALEPEADTIQSGSNTSGLSTHDELYRSLKYASKRKDAATIRKSINAFKALPKEQQTTAGFNMIMESLLSIRKYGQPVQEITDTYNDMIQAGLSPNSRTYTVLVKALCQRDAETNPTPASHAAEPTSDANQTPFDGAHENNFDQAIQLMGVAHSSRNWFSDHHAYNAVLSSCALRGDVDRALSVLELLERSLFANTDAVTFKHLIRTFVTDPNLKPDETQQMQEARKLAACKQVFDEFLLASQNSEWKHEHDDLVWSSLLDAHFALNDAEGAVKLFERMLDGGENVPALQVSVISSMIRGFLNIGDSATALHWFAKVSPHVDETVGALSVLPLPNPKVTEQLVAALASAEEQYLEPLSRVFDVYLTQRANKARDASLSTLALVIDANIASAQRLLSASAVEEASAPLDRALRATAAFFIQEATRFHQLDPLNNVEQTCKAVHAIFNLTDALLTAERAADAGSALTYAGLFLEKADLKAPPFETFAPQLEQLASRFMTTNSNDVNADLAPVHLFASAEFVAPVLRAADLLDEYVATNLAKLYRHVRNKAPDAIRSLPLSTDAWVMILEAFCFEEQNVRSLNLEAFKAEGIPIVLHDLAELPAAAGESVEGSAVRPHVNTRKAVEVTVARYGEDALSLLPEWVIQNMPAAMEGVTSVQEEDRSEAGSASQVSASTPATTPPQQRSPLDRQDLPAPTLSTGSTWPSFNFAPVQVIDTDFGQTFSIVARPSGQTDAPRMYSNVIEQMKVGNFAHPEGLAVLIGAFGRLGNVERVEELYAMAQHVLHALVGDLTWQSSAWFVVEDAMIQALSHAGRPEAATIHRHRIIAAGGSPTSTSYAALIATIRDTTDDASVAQKLFDEAQRFGVRPTAYLFNTVISKLSRARKAERALQLFDEMTMNLRIKPTSVTYGAVINACTRIGDEQRAVQMFERMERDPDFRPRVPPYNTMMQFFIQSVPDREKALVYYRKMCAAKVEPSAHTYKLLLDLYGAIEPVQPQEMEKVFDELAANSSVSIQGTHWASLIHCYGCMLGDVERAIATFDSIAGHTLNRSRKNASGLPDAVSFEALLAVFVAHNRTDLIRPHLDRMEQAGVHMTAYVANLLIRGFSMEEGAAGLNQARALFESMCEPAAGVAAAGNHPPRAHGAGAPNPTDADATAAALTSPSPSPSASPSSATGTENAFGSVQREPSTYEAMIRAELKHGNVDRARALIDRMEARAFPPALIIHARALVSNSSAHANAKDQEAVLAQLGRLSFGQVSPRLSHAGLYSAPLAQSVAHKGNDSVSVRHASTMAGSGAAAPAPGPPKPNSPFTIFDRATKTLQKDRGALKPSIVAQEKGHAFDADSTRGQASRQTDYVRRAIAESLADRVQDIKRDFSTIVELGAGPGFLRHYLEPEGSGVKKIIMCDTSSALLHRDQHLDKEFKFEVERRVIDEEALPFEEGSLDCVVVSGGLHWTNDLPGVLIQIRRALKPDGVFIAALCGGDTLFELRTSVQLAEQEREGGISPRISPMADTRDMASLLSRAGFTIPTVDVDEVSVGYPSMYELMHDLRDMGESNAVINRRVMLRRDTMLAAGAIYEALHGNEQSKAGESEGGVPATFQLIFLIGWSPAPTQPKPLKRGSAKSRMKEVLSGQDGDVQSQAEKEMKENEMRQAWMTNMKETTPSKNNK